MNYLNQIIHSHIGWFHFITAVVALISGTIVILNVKGTTFHKRIGYIYVFSMLALNITSFFIINFGGFSLFHFFAIVSLLTVLAGMVAVWRKRKNWFASHFYYMSWSIVGLYAALWAEIGTRFVSSTQQFWWVVAIATFVTVGIGSRLINKMAKELKIK